MFRKRQKKEKKKKEREKEITGISRSRFLYDVACVFMRGSERERERKHHLSRRISGRIYSHTMIRSRIGLPS